MPKQEEPHPPDGVTGACPELWPICPLPPPTTTFQESGMREGSSSLATGLGSVHALSREDQSGGGGRGGRTGSWAQGPQSTEGRGDVCREARTEACAGRTVEGLHGQSPSRTPAARPRLLSRASPAMPTWSCRPGPFWRGPRDWSRWRWNTAQW